MIVYKTTNLINGKFYIGKDSKNDPKYLGSGILLNKAIDKYGADNFVKEILERCSTIEELNNREQYWILKLDAKNKGYNIADGGHGGNTYNEEISKRVSDFIKKRPVSVETRKKRSKSMKGKYTLTWFISEYGEVDGTELYNKRCNEVGEFHRGKTISDEQKEKLSKRMKNFDNYSAEFLEMQKGENKMGEKNPMWGKVGVLNKRSRPILQLDSEFNLIAEWESINLAKKTLKISSIPFVLSKKREFAGGFRWKYKNDI